jgi:hypothetical protein
MLDMLRNAQDGKPINVRQCSDRICSNGMLVYVSSNGRDLEQRTYNSVINLENGQPLRHYVCTYNDEGNRAQCFDWDHGTPWTDFLKPRSQTGPLCS